MELSERFSKEFVALIRSARKEQNLSQAKLASAAGVSRSALTMIEAGERRPTLVVCFALSRALNEDFSELAKRAQKAASS